MNRNYVIFAAVVVVVVLFLFGGLTGPFAVPGNRDVNDHGTVTVHSLHGEDKTAISVWSTLAAEDELLVKWLPDTDYKGEVTCGLYAVGGAWLESGVWNLETSGNQVAHRWTFTLVSVPKGTTAVYCAFGGQYTEDVTWVGSTIQFNIYSTVAPTYDPIVFTIKSGAESVTEGELVTLRWWFISKGPATGTITVDGVEVSSRSTTPSPQAQPFTHSFVSNVVGTHTVKLTITPESGTAVSSSCEVTVTLAGKNGNGDEDSLFFYIMIGIIVIVGVIVVVKVVR